MSVMDIFEIAVATLIVLFAIFSIATKDMMKSVLFLSAVSLFVVVAFLFLAAPDVAITEAVIGSGLVTSLFVFTLISLKKGGLKL
jgi:energy-converting hydrogenase B subunit D